jgi:hypothetical protein
MQQVIRRVISGGQTGVDRAALDAALAVGVAHGGWCPRGRMAEDGRIPDAYWLRETATADYEERTWANVRAAAATLILTRGVLMGGSLETKRACQHEGRPWLHLDLRQVTEDEAIQQAATWWQRASAGAAGTAREGVLNVAGSRASQAPGIEDNARRIVLGVLKLVNGCERGQDGGEGDGID